MRRNQDHPLSAYDGSPPQSTARVPPACTSPLGGVDAPWGLASHANLIFTPWRVAGAGARSSARSTIPVETLNNAVLTFRGVLDRLQPQQYTNFTAETPTELQRDTPLVAPQTIRNFT